MKQVIQVTRKRGLKSEKMAILRMELDYELAVLYEALEENNDQLITSSKEKLVVIRQDLLDLTGGL
ncbi:hypothetical protein [Jeotgalibacillus campisalis]|uniref:Uncharacterized protein n=1 Tax=Jeotgalibacillus campisalis TaxID=220754 RepID=A0A0C2VUA0_9BACL|nr:hypothetical protein [Jeotgalibacillus campisalis]KIL47563.1 hypothetical protein KR50_17300 [Jeotgalibacillus campisalis]